MQRRCSSGMELEKKWTYLIGLPMCCMFPGIKTYCFWLIKGYFINSATEPLLFHASSFSNFGREYDVRHTKAGPQLLQIYVPSTWIIQWCMKTQAHHGTKSVGGWFPNNINSCDHKWHRNAMLSDVRTLMHPMKWHVQNKFTERWWTWTPGIVIVQFGR